MTAPSLLFKAAVLLLFLLPFGVLSQPAPGQITVSGTVHEKNHPQSVLNEMMVVNLNTQHGFFGKSDGTFQTVIHRTDTLLIGATGYSTVKICFADSLHSIDFFVEITLQKLSVQLKEVQIFSPRDLQEIEKDIQKLGYNKEDYEISGVDALQSPITFLYQQFSRLEKLKRHNRERINEEKKRILLKELLHRYVAWDIISLDDDEFDRFVDFCNVPEEFMKTSTQYDFIEYIKGKYFVFRALKR